MIRNIDKLRRFETAQARKEKPNFFRNLKIFEGLFLEGVNIGVLPPANPLEGIEVDIRLAKCLDRV